MNVGSEPRRVDPIFGFLGVCPVGFSPSFNVNPYIYEERSGVHNPNVVSMWARTASWAIRRTICNVTRSINDHPRGRGCARHT